PLENVGKYGDTCSGRDLEFGAGPVDELADGGFAAPGGEGVIELADIVLGPARLDAGEDVDGAVA
ncbi:MAG: hypothetical protein ACRDTD_23280, partial [Pseudonocardiaceae bacterium]